MRRKRYNGEQIALAPRQAEGGTVVEGICRNMGVSEAIFSRRNKRFAGMGVVGVRRLKQLEGEDAKLKVGSGAPHGRRPDARPVHAAGRTKAEMVNPAVRREVTGTSGRPTASASGRPAPRRGPAGPAGAAASAPTRKRRRAGGCRRSRAPGCATVIGGGTSSGDGSAGNPPQGAPPQAGLAPPAGLAGGGRTQRGRGHGLRGGPASRRTPVADPDGRRPPRARGARDSSEGELSGLPGHRAARRAGKPPRQARKPSGGHVGSGAAGARGLPRAFWTGRPIRTVWGSPSPDPASPWATPTSRRSTDVPGADREHRTRSERLVVPVHGGCLGPDR